MSAHPGPNTSLNGQGHNKDIFSVEDLGNHAIALVEASQQTNHVVSTQTIRADTIDFKAWLEVARVRPTDEIEEDPACLMIEKDGKSYVIGTPGNLSTIAGRAKAKKTFAVSVAVASAVASTLILNRIKGQLPKNRPIVLLFDTEQSRAHVLKVVKRICRLCGVEDPPNLIVYSLRPFAPTDRLKAIDFALNNTPGLGLVVIDGIRDLAIDPVLDSEQASHVMTHLLQWTDRLKIHIMCVLHQNKNDSNLRGHLGTELVNKSETVISISRDPNDKEVSIVAPEYCRNKEFEEFRFSVDDTGLPFLVDGDTNDSAGPRGPQPNQRKALKPKADNISNEEIRAIILRAFEQDSLLSYGQLLINIGEASSFVGASMAKRELEELIRRVTRNALLVKVRPDKFRWDVYQINEAVLADSLP